MHTPEQTALRCIHEIDALLAAVRYNDAAAAALLQPRENRRADFDEWLAEQRASLGGFVEGRNAAPEDLAQIAGYVKWLLKSYTKDARVFRFASWFVTRVLGMKLPLRPTPEADGPAHPRALGAVSWVFVAAAVALWLAAR